MKLQIALAALAATFLATTQTLSAQITALPKANGTEKVSQGHFEPWHPIMERDILRRRRVWEEIRTPDDKLLGLANYRRPLLDVLINGINDGKIKVYANPDDRFTRELTKEEFSAQFGKTNAASSHITKYMIKEDSLYVNNGETTVRIVGLAPVSAVTQPDGTVKEEPMFWIYYPDCRPYFSEAIITGTGTWDDFFERRYFTQKITRMAEPYIMDRSGVKK